jgi:hypothetical protein
MHEILELSFFETYIKPIATVPVFTLFDLQIPDWAFSRCSLFVIINDQFDAKGIIPLTIKAQESCCQILFAGTTGLGLPQTESLNSGYFLGYLLALANHLGIIPDVEVDFRNAIKTIEDQYEKLRIEIPAVNNPAKRQGGQLMGRWVYIIAGEQLETAAKYWKQQINLFAKAWAHSESIPQVLSSSVEGICYPGHVNDKIIVLFIDADCYSPRDRQTIAQLKQGFMLEGINTDLFIAKGNSVLAQLFSTLQFGDYMAYYLAAGYETDPGARAMRDQFDW